MSSEQQAPPPQQRYGRYVGLLGVLIVVAITVNTILTKPGGVTGVPPGQRLPPFAAPLVTGDVRGPVNVSRHPHEGLAKLPACSVRGAGVLNICELYEQGPVVLALFVEEGGCADVLGDMQSLVSVFPQVRFAAVSIKGSQSRLARLVRSRGIGFPVGIDEEGVLTALYKQASCPQITFAYPGGLVQSRALLSRPSRQELRRRVQELVRASPARGSEGGPG